jgi:hypothetical protein
MDEQTVEKNETIESSSSISSNDLLTTIYDIIRSIFCHLPIRSTDSCSLVCQSWSYITRLIKKHRHSIYTLTYPIKLVKRKIGNRNFDIGISSILPNFKNCLNPF